MPKSFGNKTFIVPPSRVVATEDAADLADLHEAMKHMTIMNRFTSRLNQAIRRVVLSSGATAILRRSFGHETITLNRLSPPSFVETLCEPYMESGRQRWDSGLLDISGDLSGICNGPCPGTPLTDGAISASLQVAGAATLREYAPPSSFTGKLHFMVQALYGTKRTDMNYAEDGELTVADILFGHSWTRSSILYTDAAGKYWLLQLQGMESATIQSWKPCSERFSASTLVSEAYRLSLCQPASEAITLSCAGTRTDIGEPFAYGWHTTAAGNEGHVVAVESVAGDPLDYFRTRLCRFVLSDSGNAQTPGQTLEDYISSRFSITFSVLSETALFRMWYLWRIHRPNYAANVHSSVQEDGANSGGEYVTEISDAPVYCIYTANDTLNLVTYSFARESYHVEVDNNWPYCGYGEGTHTIYENKNIVGGFFVSNYTPPSTASGTKDIDGQQTSIISSGGSGGDCDLGLLSVDFAHMACEAGALAEWNSFYAANYENCRAASGDSGWIPDAITACGVAQKLYMENTKKHYVQQVLLLPFGHHEAVHLHALDATACLILGQRDIGPSQPVAVTELRAICPPISSDTMTVNWTIGYLPSGLPSDRMRRFGLDWSRTIYTYAKHDSGTLRQSYFGSRGEITCDDFSYEFEEIDETSTRDGYLEMAPTWFSQLPDIYFTRYNNIPLFFGREAEYLSLLYSNELVRFYTWYDYPNDTGAQYIKDVESYYHGHRLAWFTGDKSIEAHDGYDEFVDDGCFVGAS